MVFWEILQHHNIWALGNLLSGGRICVAKWCFLRQGTLWCLEMLNYSALGSNLVQWKYTRRPQHYVLEHQNQSLHCRSIFVWMVLVITISGGSEKQWSVIFNQPLGSADCCIAFISDRVGARRRVVGQFRLLFDSLCWNGRWECDSSDDAPNSQSILGTLVALWVTPKVHISQVWEAHDRAIQWGGHI